MEKYCRACHVNLNLALVNIAPARKDLPPELEKLLYNKKTLNEARDVAAQHPRLGETIVDSMQQVVCTLSQHFRCMDIKGEAMQITQACTDIDMQNLCVKIFEIQKNLVYENIN